MKVQKLSSLTIFFPFFNNAETVLPLLSQAYSFGAQVTDDLEVIALHGGPSTDHTLEEILKAQIQYSSLIVIDQSQNREGYAVIRQGFSAATKEWVFYTDGDGQYQLDELRLLVETALTSSSSVVNGFKVRRSDSWARTFFGKGYQLFCRYLFKLPIRDIDCDFRLIKRKYLQQIQFSCKSSSILPELILNLQYFQVKFSEIPVKHHPRIYGKSSYSVFSLFKEKFIGDLSLYLRWKSGRYIFPSSGDSIFHSMQDVEERLWWYVGLRQTIIHCISQISLLDPVVCDLGCGTGRNLEALQQEGYCVQGIDVSPIALDLCQKKGLTCVSQGSITSIPLENSSVDIAIVADVFCMLTNQETTQALREIYRTLKPGGFLIIHEPAFNWLKSQHDIICHLKARFNKKELILLLNQQGFELEYATYRVFFLFPFVVGVKFLKKLMLCFGCLPKSDLKIPLFNQLFLMIQRGENSLLKRRLCFPFGSSVFLQARRSNEKI